MTSKKERKMTKDQELHLLKQNVKAMRSTFIEMFDAMEARIDHLLPGLEHLEDSKRPDRLAASAHPEDLF